MRESGITLRERTLELAQAFLEDVRHELEVATAQRFDLPPRIRTMHTRAGHATPEYRTIAIPRVRGEEASTTLMSEQISRYARAKLPCSIVLVFDALMQGEGGERCPVLIAEARDRWGTRLFLMQPFRFLGERVEWLKPVEGGWRDPGEQEMILDASFDPAAGEEAARAAEDVLAPVRGVE